MKRPEILSALQPVVSALEKFSVPYYISGSIASSVFGLARATLDIDIVADVKDHHVSLLRQELEKSYYISEEMMKDAIQSKSSFNLIHLETSIKIDVFLIGESPHQQSAIQRRVRDTFEDDDVQTEYYFSSPEDVIISKLKWYESGGKVSERQWHDVIGVMKVQGNSLDTKYLQKWANQLGVYELLKIAYSDAGIQL